MSHYLIRRRIGVAVIDTRTGKTVVWGSYETLAQAMEYHAGMPDTVPGDAHHFRAIDVNEVGSRRAAMNAAVAS